MLKLVDETPKDSVTLNYYQQIPDYTWFINEEYPNIIYYKRDCNEIYVIGGDLVDIRVTEPKKEFGVCKRRFTLLKNVELRYSK